MSAERKDVYGLCAVGFRGELLNPCITPRTKLQELGLIKEVPHGTVIACACGEGIRRSFCSTSTGWVQISQFPQPLPIELEMAGYQHNLDEIYDQWGRIVWQR